MAFHLVYRPIDFGEIYGNKAVVNSLVNLFEKEDRNKIPHTFLLEGLRGCGKTTLARIICSKIEKTLLIELNAANTRGIDTIREIIDISKGKPLGYENTCYIMDETHQLSKDAQNAFLKILEDTPNYIYFLLCTTDPQKIIPTILNRCARYRVSKLRDGEIRALVEDVGELEKIELTGEKINLIVRSANGVPRSALIILDQIKGIDNIEEAGEIALDCIYEDEKEIIEICRKMSKNLYKSWKDFVEDYRQLAIEPEPMRRIMLGYFSKCLLGAGEDEERVRYASYCCILIRANINFFGEPALITALAGIFAG